MLFNTITRLCLATLLGLAVSLHGEASLAQAGDGADTTSLGNQADIQVEAFLNLTRMSFDDTVTLTLRLTWDKDEFEPVARSAPKLDLQRLRVASMASTVRQLDEDKLSKSGGAKISQEYSYTLLPTASGEGVVRPVRVAFIRKSDSQSGSVSTGELSVSISMPTPKGEPEGKDWRIIGLVIVAVSVAVVFALVIMQRKRRARASEELLSQARKGIVNDLVALKAATSGSKAEFFEKLYGFLYDYLHDAGHIAARKGDSEALIAELRQSALGEDSKLLLINWLELSATEKFSPGRGTPGESLRVYYEVDAFVRENWLTEERRATDESNDESN